MAGLKLADAYVDITINRSQLDSGLALAVSRLKQLDGLGAVSLRLNRSQADASLAVFQQRLRALQGQTTITPQVNRGQATAALGLIRQQLTALGNAATINPTVRARGAAGAGAGGVGRGGLGGAGGLIAGAAQGLGLSGFALSPAHALGQFVGGGAAEAVSTAMELETTFADLRRVSGLTAEAMDGFKQKIFDISTTQAGVSVKDLTDIAGAGARSGVADREGVGGLETFTRSMAQVRNAVSGIETEQLANEMTRVLNLFGKGVGDIAGFGSALTAMDNVSTSTASDILSISTGLAGTAANIGITIPQLLAFSSVLKDVGLSNAQASGSFSQIFRMMASDTEKFAAKIGVPAAEFRQAMQTDVMGALGMVVEKFKEIASGDSVAAQEWIAELGFKGVRTAGALQQLASKFGEVASRSKLATDETTSLNALTEANAIKSATSASEVQKFKNSLVELADAIGGKLLPAVAGIASVGTTAAKSLSGAIGSDKVVNEKGEVVERTQENSLTGPLGLTMTPAATEKEIKDAETLKAFNARAEKARKEADAAEGPAARRAAMLKAEEAERAAVQAKSDADLRARGIRLPGEATPTRAERIRSEAEAEVAQVAPDKEGKIDEGKVEARARVVEAHERRLTAEHDQQVAAEVRARGDGPKTVEERYAVEEDNAAQLGQKLRDVGTTALGLFTGGPEGRLGTLAAGAQQLAARAAEVAEGGAPKLADAIPEAEKEKEKFQSRKFGDSADFASEAISTALNEKDDKTLEAQKEANDHLREIRDAIKEQRSDPGANKGPILRT